jgi:hypothetical protein
MAVATSEGVEAERVLPIPEPESRRRHESYEELVSRLSVQSVRKHYDAYEDVDWDAPEMQIRRDDPRFELQDDTLAQTDWYKALPQPLRAEIGLTAVAGAMKFGVVFESVLKRGLLEFAFSLPNRSPEFRYVYHEVIEEAQHSLMFQEFINRSGMNPRGLPGLMTLGTRFVVRLGRVFPALFFFFVLGGEEPIDHAQKRHLRAGRDLHPLLKRLMQIHITEEARHLCFARNYLQRTVPQLGWFARLRLAVAVPIILGEMARLMLQPSKAMIRRFAIPRQVVREAYTENREHRRKVRESLSSVAKLCIELGLVNRATLWVWRAAGLGNPYRYAR